jgi:hypothetical protein
MRHQHRFAMTRHSTLRRTRDRSAPVGAACEGAGVMLRAAPAAAAFVRPLRPHSGASRRPAVRPAARLAPAAPARLRRSAGDAARAGARRRGVVRAAEGGEADAGPLSTAATAVASGLAAFKARKYADAVQRFTEALGACALSAMRWRISPRRVARDALPRGRADACRSAQPLRPVRTRLARRCTTARALRLRCRASTRLARTCDWRACPAFVVTRSRPR